MVENSNLVNTLIASKEADLEGKFFKKPGLTEED